MTSATERRIKAWGIVLVTVVTMETRRTGVRYTRAISLGTFVTSAMQTGASYKIKEREELH